MSSKLRRFEILFPQQYNDGSEIPRKLVPTTLIILFYLRWSGFYVAVVSLDLISYCRFENISIYIF